MRTQLAPLKKTIVFLLAIFFVFQGAMVALAVARSGDFLWARKVNSASHGAEDIAVDKNGNVYTLATKDNSSYDMLLTKYGPGGAKRWSRTYNSPGSRDEIARALAIDQYSNIYVTGTSGAYTAFAGDIVVIKYNSRGRRQWVRRHNGPANGYDWAGDIAVDSDRNVYVTGGSVSRSGDDVIVMRFRSNGKRVWARRYNGPANLDDGGRSLSVRGRGYVVVTGESMGRNNGNNWVTIRYDRSGNRRWVRRFNGQGNSDDVPAGVVVDSRGRSYVSGQAWMNSGPNVTTPDIVTIRYNSNGSVSWIRRYNGRGNGYDNAHAIAIDRNDNIVVVGETDNGGGNYNFVTMRMGPGGGLKWRRQHNGGGNDFARKVAIGKNNSVLVTGESGNDLTTIKYSGGGIRRWTRRYNAGGYDWTAGIAADNRFGNVFMAGGSSNSGAAITTVKYKQ